MTWYQSHEELVLEQGLITSIHPLHHQFEETKSLSTDSPEFMKLKSYKKHRK